MHELPLQLDLEGFCYYTPSDEHVRNAFLKITAPIPEKRRLQRLRPVMRWKVYLIGNASTNTTMKGVCASSGYMEMIEAAVEALRGRETRKDQSYACFYGLVDYRGSLIYHRSRYEIVHEIDDDANWPRPDSCSCSKCSKTASSSVLLPPITSEPASNQPVPFRARELPSNSQDALQSINHAMLLPDTKE